MSLLLQQLPAGRAPCQHMWSCPEHLRDLRSPKAVTLPPGCQEVLYLRLSSQPCGSGSSSIPAALLAPQLAYYFLFCARKTLSKCKIHVCLHSLCICESEICSISESAASQNLQNLQHLSTARICCEPITPPACALVSLSQAMGMMLQ